MNILLATDANVERSGICLFMLNWVRGVRQIDKEGIIVAYFRKGILHKDIVLQYNNLGVKVVYGNLPQDASNVSSKNRKKIRSDVRGLLKKYDFDVLHVNSSAAGFSSLVLIEGKKAGVPIRISHSHGRNLDNGIKNVYLWYLKYLIKKNSTQYAGCSIDAGRYLFGDKGIKTDKWHFIPNTIDTKKFAFDCSSRVMFRDKLEIENNAILLGATGLLINRKNHIFLLPLVKNLKQKNIKVKLLILGEGEKRYELEEESKRLGIEDDVYLPGVSDEIPEWLSAMDFYVMPSLTEGLPIGAVEAQANGLYCLLSNKVPPDVDITPNVFHLPMNEGTDAWEKKICELMGGDENQRKNGVDLVKRAGFDSQSITLYIRTLYGMND